MSAMGVEPLRQESWVIATAALPPPKRKCGVLRCERQLFVLQRLRRASAPNIVRRRLWVESDGLRFSNADAG